MDLAVQIIIPLLTGLLAFCGAFAGQRVEIRHLSEIVRELKAEFRAEVKTLHSRINRTIERIHDSGASQ